MKLVTTLAALVLAGAGLATQAATPPAATSLKGEVLEVLNVDSYTYLRLKTPDGERWAAVPTAAVTKGAQVTVGNAMTMDNFESKSLKRKFDKIVFGQLADPSGKPAAPHGTAPAMAAARAPLVKVAKASGADARTVAEVVKTKSSLKDKTVLVRGQVMKVSNGILGKNWVHLQDGSGSAADGSNDILVTTQDEVAVGDVVNAKGTVHTDVNLGSGYAYAVVIENASVRK